MVKVDLSGAKNFFDTAGPDYAAAAAAHRLLLNGEGAGAEFTGWLDLPKRVLNTELPSIKSAAERIRSRSDALVVVGIGGSYLGARAAYDLLRRADNDIRRKTSPEIYFVGNNLSSTYMSEISEQLGYKDFSINVISKSGTTLEPAVSFRIFKELLERKYGTSGAKKRIYATTDASKGVLKSMADIEGYEKFVVPDDVGGRYSVLSAVGLLPLAVAGIDVERIINAAIEEMRALSQSSPENPAWQYAAARQNLYRQGKDIELLAYYEPAFRYMAEWWKQLYGESEGKNGIGIFPASVEYTADLHSMGQYVQDGPRRLIETVVSFERSRDTVSIPFNIGDADGLNYLAGKKLDYVNRTAAEAVRAAHISGGVPNLEISVPTMDEEGFAALVCFFEVACAISGYISGVNPFDQPGVEAYKQNMFKMLGKPQS